MDCERIPGQLSCTTLEQIDRERARGMLQKAIEDEVIEYIRANGSGHRLVVRNGHKPAHTILTGMGSIEVEPPRVNSKIGRGFGGRVARGEAANLPAI